MINNKETNRSICEVYNDGIKQANGAIICFCHDDIIFHSEGWGKYLRTLLETNNEIGLVGVAGTVYKSAVASPWVAIPYKYYRVNMIQQKKQNRTDQHKQLGPGKYTEVAVLDGCFIAGKKNIFEEYKWNYELLKGFHLYDLDISIRVGKHHKLVVSNEILLTHLSEGNFDSKWLYESEKFHKHYKSMLPVCVITLDRFEQRAIEYYTLHAHILTLLHLKQPMKKVLHYYFKAVYTSPFKYQNISLLKRIMR